MNDETGNAVAGSAAASGLGPATARSLLFVPGTRPERFDKARAAGADLVVIDLEDAVAADDKAVARENATRYVRDGSTAVVRLNPGESLEAQRDLEALAGSSGLLAAMIPKCSTPQQIEAVRAALGVPVLPLVESAAGVEATGELARCDGVARLCLGDQDLLADLGADGPDIVGYARHRLAYASAAAGLPGPVDGVSLALKDVDVVRADTARARSLGFTGKLCIHPAQVEAVNAGFTPEADAIAWARGIVAATGKAGQAGGAVVVSADGAMVGAPVVARARRILAAATAASVIHEGDDA